MLQGADTCTVRDELSEQGEVAGDVRCWQPHSSGESDVQCFVVSPYLLTNALRHIC